MSPLLAQFLAEARELLEGAADKLMRLERQPDDPGLVNELFRLVHTLKGNSGLFEFPEMTRVLHAAEDLMDAVRQKRLPYSQSIADHLLDAMDFVMMLCDSIETEAPADPSAASDAAGLAKSLRGLIPVVTLDAGAAPPATVTLASVATTASFRWQQLPEAARQAAEAKGAALLPLLWLSYRPVEESFFQGVDPFFSARKTPGLLWGRVVPREAWPPLAELNAYRCLLDFEVLTSAAKAELLDHYRYVPDQITLLPVQRETPPPAPATALDPAAAELYATQRQILLLEDGAEWKEGRIRAAAQVLVRCAENTGNPAGAALVGPALEKSLADGNTAALVSWIDEQLAPLAVPVPAPTTAESRPTDGAADEPSRFSRRADDTTTELKSLRVDQSKIDRLMDLIGELVVSKNALPYLAQRAEVEYGVRELSREIKNQYGVINRISGEMQDAILQVRMLPVSFVFQRFPRLVREISRKLGKEINLVLEGEDTEADKSIITSLADPLMHIVRNSLDHGIELPEARQKAGKPVMGTLSIRASQEADRVVIEIVDDGKGIDPAVIRRKALENGLMTAEALDALTDHQAIQLVFAAGLSTAEKISDLSGRGVGMDVVKTAVEHAGGVLELESTLGQGTRIRIGLPLSMAMTQVLLVESDGQLFGVPMEQVVESVRIPKSSVRTIKRSLTTVLRGQVVPLKSLNTLLGIKAAPQANADGEWAVLVVRLRDEVVGLLVDQFHQTTDIIQKPLDGILAHLAAYSGSALLGDGSVLMVLNLKAVLV
jgi:two-component system chemotaxis sensor kinase CheA